MKRRDFLKLSSAAGLAGLNVALIGKALGQNSGFTPADRDPVAHVINRLTFGVTPELYDYVHQIGVDDFIEEQLNPESIDDSECDQVLTFFPLINEHASVLIRDYGPNREPVDVALLASTVVRSLYSKRQLYERTVQFWSDHFSIFLGKEQKTIFLKVDNDRDVIRAHTFGTFRELLGADAYSPAMLFYLDNHVSSAEYPNENYARELMELHTLGVNGGYTEDDVKEVARAFTGWSLIDSRDLLGETAVFTFRTGEHDTGEKLVLGHTLAAGRGEEDGNDVLDILAAHPSTARFIATKLARRFVSDFPSDTVVTAATQTFTDTGGDIRATMRTIFNSEEFWNAPPKFKRPFEYTMGVIRALGYPPSSIGDLGERIFQALTAMGHLPFWFPAPNGYPDVAAYWMSNLLPRWNVAIGAVLNGGDFENLREFLNHHDAGADLDTFLTVMSTYLLGRELTEQELTVARDFSESIGNGLTEHALAGTALLIASPAFQVS